MEPDLPKSPASRRGRSQEGSCCPERTPRLLTSTAGENGGRQMADGDKKAGAAQIATQGLPRTTKAAKKSGKQKRKESRRLVLPREDAKAVEKYSRRERRTADGGQRQEGLCCPERTPRLLRSTAGENGGHDGGWRQEGSCCADSYSRTPSTWLPRLPRSLASRRGRSQEGSCCPERTPRLLRSTAGENGGWQTADGEKKACAAQIATQGRHPHGYQGCQEVRQAEEEGVKKARVAQRGRQGC